MPQVNEMHWILLIFKLFFLLILIMNFYNFFFLNSVKNESQNKFKIFKLFL